MPADIYRHHARLFTDGRIWRWLIVTRPDQPNQLGTSGIACHRSRSLLIATLSLWWWLRRTRNDTNGSQT